MSPESIALIYGYTAIGVGVLLGLAAIGGAIGWSVVASKCIEGIARQPEMRPVLMIQTFIFGGLAEAIPIIAVGIAMWFAVANPFVAGAQALLGG